MADDPDAVVCVPMKLDAFVLNPSLCAAPPLATVAPITQPNYTFLRLDQDMIQSDLTSHVDLHGATECVSNSRVTDLGTGQPLNNRFGVYLHWSLPRFYRAGVSSSASDLSDAGRQAEQQRRNQAGFNTGPDDSTFDSTAPDFRAVPNRWLVVRRLHLDTVVPQAARNTLPEFKAWVIESDRLDKLEGIPPDRDLEVEYAPYIQGDGSTLRGQAENFIGFKTDAVGADGKVWSETPSKRVSLSVLNSSNPLFADYCPHNGNVFSMLDPFEYNGGKLESATASYSVIGWHSDDTVGGDPFTITYDSKLPLASQPNRGTRLDGCHLTFPDNSPDPGIWLKSGDSCRTLCHGAMYGVQFSAGDRPPNSPADKLATLLATVSPVTVGTTPLDTVMAFIDAHIDDANFAAEKDALTKLEAIEPLLLKQQEDADAQYEAQDMLSDHNFAASADTDSHWHLTGENADGRPLQPTPAQLVILDDLNQRQAALDQANRELRQERWNLWSQWWTYFSTQQGGKDGDYSPKVTATSQHIAALARQAQAWNIYINGDGTSANPGKAASLPCAKSSRQRFFSLKDPTMLVTGLSSPWPTDYLDKLKVRLGSQVIPYSTTGKKFNGWSGYEHFVAGSPADKIPAITGVFPTASTQDVGAKLLYEFFMLHPPDNNSSDPWQPADAGFFPLYHDLGDVGKTRDCWQTQPWFPLFVEWEADYFHIDYAKWQFESVDNLLDLPVPAPSRFRYGMAAGVDLPHTGGIADDVRTIFGRMLILPQPAFSLADNITSLFATMSSADLEKLIPGKTARDALITAVKELPFLSSPMAGFTDHLITRNQGTHIKPTRRAPGTAIVSSDDGLKPTAGFSHDQLLQMDVQTTTTPYGSSVTFPTGWAISPFKPATHGQFRFNKLNIIDKFGQAVCAIDPRPANPPPSLHPVLSEYYRPQVLADQVTPNTITVDPKDHCQYGQIPPNINQDARLNACFLTRDKPSSGMPNPPWRPVNEWESPLWGWIVVNYVESGLQIFLPDGTFYREVRLGGVGGDTLEPTYKPFKAPSSVTQSGVTEYTLPLAQLDSLLTKLGDKGYLKAFIDMVTNANNAFPYAPSDYAQYMSAIIGRPLALVNTGWSLELACPPFENLSTEVPGPPARPLSGYQFPLRIGDPSRLYDGTVAYFRASPAAPATPGQGPTAGQEDDLGTIFTHYPGEAPTERIDTPNLPLLTPYHIDKLVDVTAGGGTTAVMDLAELQSRQCAQFHVVSAVVDPFTPMHGYTGILPIQTLQVPAWAAETALRRMAAFFTVGPLIVPRMVAYDAGEKLDPEKDYAARTEAGNAPPGKGAPIPVASSKDWLWLQPFDDKDETQWNAVGVEVMDLKPKFEPGPYLAVEGYLQMKQGLDTPSS